MLSFIYGVLGAVFAAALFAAGAVVGWKMKGKSAEAQHHEAVKQYTDQQLKSMRDYEEAFGKMLEYNTDIAYRNKIDEDGLNV